MNKLGVITIIIIIILLIDFFLYIICNVNIDKTFNKERYNNFLDESSYHIDINRVNIGKKKAQNSKIVICTLCRNVEHNSKKSMEKLEGIGNLFNEYKIVVYENDSTDNTRNIIKNWSSINKNVHLIDCCEYSSCNCKLKTTRGYDDGAISNKRMYKMAFYRNEYIKYTFKHFKDYDYLLVYDFDLSGGILKSGIYDSLSYENWDSISANGLTPLPPFCLNSTMYDALAYLPKNYFKKVYNYSPLKRFIKLYLLQYSKVNLIPVDSAFNGMTIYNMNSIKDCKYEILKYDNIDDENINCEHLGFHYNMIKNNKTELFINKKMILHVGIQGPDNKFQFLNRSSNRIK